MIIFNRTNSIARLLSTFTLSALLVACSGSSDSTDTTMVDEMSGSDSMTDSMDGADTDTTDSDTNSTNTTDTDTNNTDTNDADTTDADSTDDANAISLAMTNAANGVCEKSDRRATTESGPAPYLGNIYRPETQTDERFLQLWNQVTPENASKWNQIEATRNNMVWATLDDAYAFAKDNSYQFKFHTLIAGDNTPDWMASLSPADQLLEVTQWFDEVAARYPDLSQIDVVSEPISSVPVYRDALGGEGATGYDWVVRAFELARERFPNSQLLLNDYKVAKDDATGAQFLALANVLKQENLLDGVGVEGHFLEDTDASAIKEKLDLLAALDVPIYLSDLDLNFADDANQFQKMRAVFPVFYENFLVKGLTFWGYRQNQLWRSDAYLLRQDETDRPALDWLECYLFP